MKIKSTIVAIVLIVPLFWAGLLAQSGIVKGKVVDSEGNGIPDAEIRIQGMDVNREYKIKSNKDGEFLHIGVNFQGVYRIIASKEGYTGGFIEGVRPRSDRGGDGVIIEMEEGSQRQMSFEMSDEDIQKLQEQRKTLKEQSEKLQNAFQAGLDAFSAEDFETAKDQFQIAAEAAPDEPNVWGNLGQTHARLGEYPEAAAAYEKAIELKPAEAAFHQNLGGVYSSMGESAKAKAMYEKAAELAAATNPQAAADSYYNMAVGFINSGQNSEAYEALSKAVEFNPEHAEAHYQLGIVLLGLNKFDECKTHFERYIELRPDSENAAVAQGILESLK